MEVDIKKAIFKYSNMLKFFRTIKNIEDKNYDRTYYKLIGMESILESLGVDINEIQNESYEL